MNRNFILDKVKNKKLGIKDTISTKTPIAITLVNRNCKNYPDYKVITLKIRDDVGHFSQNSRWSVYFDKDSRRLYFFYGEDVKSYSVGKGKGFHFITFSDGDIVEIFKKENKPKTIHTIWNYDKEARMFYAEI